MFTLDLNPISFGANLGIKTGTAITNALFSGRSVAQDLASVFSRPNEPVVINNPPQTKTLADQLGIGFIEKNVIIIGVLALGGVAIYAFINRR